MVTASRKVGVPVGGGFDVVAKPVDEAQGVWRDERRGTIITAIPAGTGTTLLYRPAGR